MADEGRITIQLNIAKGTNSEFTYNRSASDQFDVTGTNMSGGVQAIGVTHEAVSISADVASKGWTFFRNLSTSVSIDLGREIAAAFEAFVTLLPGEIAAFRLKSTATLYAKASVTAGADLEYFVMEL